MHESGLMFCGCLISNSKRTIFISFQGDTGGIGVDARCKQGVKPYSLHVHLDCCVLSIIFFSSHPGGQVGMFRDGRVHRPSPIGLAQREGECLF